MRIVFRTDASLEIGSGHLMRCLVLADELAAMGAGCMFICRDHPGHLCALVEERGHGVRILQGSGEDDRSLLRGTVHAAWLGVDQLIDADGTQRALGNGPVDWLIVDHYGLDATWERAMRPHVERIFVIDDIADRAHDPDILLDQNLGDKTSAYQGLFPSDRTTLFGPRYALLAPAFASARNESIAQRRTRPLRNVLITMGGVDRNNVTGWVLDEFERLDVDQPLRLTVVMGRTAPWVNEVRHRASAMPWPTEVLVDVKDMARLMTEADLGIGAAGSTSWERCCLGSPSVLMILAENQRPIANALADVGAARVVDHTLSGAGRTFRGIMQELLTDRAALERMAHASAKVTDGLGCRRVSEIMVRSMRSSGSVNEGAFE